MPETTSNVTPVLPFAPIDDFKSILIRRNGLAPQNRYLFKMNLPNMMIRRATRDFKNPFYQRLNKYIQKFKSVLDFRDLSMLTISVTSPGKSFNPEQISRVRHPFYIPVGFFYEDIECRFMMTNDYFIKDCMDAWANLIIDPVRYRMGYAADVCSTAELYMLNQQNLPKYKLTFNNVWPATQQAMTFQADSDNTFQEVYITFKYETRTEESVTLSDNLQAMLQNFRDPSNFLLMSGGTILGREGYRVGNLATSLVKGQLNSPF